MNLASRSSSRGFNLQVSRCANFANIRCVSKSNLCFHETADEIRDLIRLRIEREVTGIQYVHFCIRHIFAIALRLARIKGQIVLTPNDKERRLGFLHPGLPFRVRLNVGAIVVEQVTLNLRLPRAVQNAYSSVQRSGS